MSLSLTLRAAAAGVVVGGGSVSVRSAPHGSATAAMFFFCDGPPGAINQARKFSHYENQPTNQTLLFLPVPSIPRRLLSGATWRCHGVAQGTVRWVWERVWCDFVLRVRPAYVGIGGCSVDVLGRGAGLGTR